MIIWVNGCFDIIHRGHIELFKFAKSFGGELMVGLDSDEKVKKDKGESRPFFCLEDRIAVVSAIRYVDVITSFGSKKELEALIEHVKPAIIVVGSDWKRKKVVGSQHAGEVKFFPRVKGYSTTEILETEII